jgi:hypothetical protein
MTDTKGLLEDFETKCAALSTVDTELRQLRAELSDVTEKALAAVEPYNKRIAELNTEIKEQVEEIDLRRGAVIQLGMKLIAHSIEEHDE